MAPPSPPSSLLVAPSPFRKFALYRPAIFHVADWLTRKLPSATVRSFARGLAEFSYWCLPRFRRHVEANLRHIVPHDPPRVRALAHQTFLNYGSQLVDYAGCAHVDNEGLMGLFACIEGTWRLDEALRRGRGAIIVTAHFGNWEVGGLLFALRGYRLNTITIEEHLDQLTQMREQYRARRGIRTIRIGRSPFSFIDVMAALRRNEVVAMLVERPLPSASVTIDFFGQPAPFSNGPVLLAMATGAAILPSFVWTEADGRYHARIWEPIDLDELEGRESSIRHNTQKIARVFEDAIRAHPDQWYNFVPIWKNQ